MMGENSIIDIRSKQIDLRPINKQKIQKQAGLLAGTESSAMALYFIGAIDACVLLNNGEYKDAFVVANSVIAHAEREGYVGIFGALDMMYVKARCLLEFSQIEESQKVFFFRKIKNTGF
jgi:hypothetical protein